MKTNIEVLKVVITRVLARYPAVQAVYLFGSHADGCANEQSDVDLGVVGSPEVLALDRVSMLADFVNEGFDRVDLVFLDQADLVVRFEAVRRNCLLFRTPEFDHGSYVSRNLRKYVDFEPYLKVQRLALKERLLSGSALGVRPEVIRRRLLQLGEYLDILDHCRQYDVESFCNDPERYGSAERFLQLAIESTLDIGAHIVADGNLGRIEQSRDVAMRFRERDYVDVDLEQRWIRMIGFRNVLARTFGRASLTFTSIAGSPHSQTQNPANCAGSYFLQPTSPSSAYSVALNWPSRPNMRTYRAQRSD